MKAFYELTRVFLVLWSFGALGLCLAALSDIAFRGHAYRTTAFFLLRFVFAWLWPFALCSAYGRQMLISIFKGV